jgi:carbamoyl-phosphate synthase large subunit
MLKGKRIFISGGAGVIGTALVEKLYELGAVILVGDLKQRPLDWPSGIFYRQGDLNYIREEELSWFQPEYFFHLAATFERSIETYEFWDENYQHNVHLSHHLMTCLKNSPTLKRVIFASSYLIYNQDLYNFAQPQLQPVRLREDAPIYPRNLTGVAKLMHEIELRFLGDFNQTGFTSAAARIYRVYGKSSRDVISRWIRSLLQGETISVYCKEGMFDYIYAGDVAEGLLRLAESDVTGIVNLGREHARRIEEVVDVLKRHFPEMKAVEGASDIPYEASEADMSRYKALLGWMPPNDIEDMIPELIKFEKSRMTEKNRGTGTKCTEGTEGTEGTGLNENSSNLMMPMMINTLVTSVSAKVPLLKALKDAYLKVGNTGKIIGGDINPNCIGRFFTDEFWQMPKLDDLTADSLINFCLDKGITTIIPTRDKELPFFAQYKEKFKVQGISIMVSDFAAVEVCLDKLEFYRKLKGLGYPAILTVNNIDELESQQFVVKERFGAGSRSIGLGLCRGEALEHAKTLQEPIFQPHINGKEYSIDVYIDLSGHTKGVVVRARELVVNGESQITATRHYKELEEMASSLVEALGLYGHIVLQVLVDEEQQFHIIECNSRFGGASTLSVQAGLDSFYWFLLESAGVDLSNYPFARSVQELRQVRHAEDLILS